MQRLMENWRKYQDTLLTEDLAQIRFDHFTGPVDVGDDEEFRVKEKPEEHIQTIRSSRQWKILKKKMEKHYLKSAAEKMREKGYSEKVIKQALNQDSLQDSLEKFMEQIEQGAGSTGGTVWRDPKNYVRKVIGVAKTPEMLQKLKKGYLEKAAQFLDRMFDKAGFQFTHDPDSTKQHEAIHFHLAEIEKAYGKKVQRSLLKSLANIFGKGEDGSPYEILNSYFIDKGTYDDAPKWQMVEEVIAWSRQVLNDDRVRKKIKSYVEDKGYDPRETINRFKKAWREAVEFSNNVKPEHLKQ